MATQHNLSRRLRGSGPSRRVVRLFNPPPFLPRDRPTSHTQNILFSPSVHMLSYSLTAPLPVHDGLIHSGCWQSKQPTNYHKEWSSDNGYDVCNLTQQWWWGTSTSVRPGYTARPENRSLNPPSGAPSPECTGAHIPCSGTLTTCAKA